MLVLVLMPFARTGHEENLMNTSKEKATLSSDMLHPQNRGFGKNLAVIL
jgi:hypothetical protein